MNWGGGGSCEGVKYYAGVYIVYECLGNLRFTLCIHVSFKLPLSDSNFMPDPLM